MYRRMLYTMEEFTYQLYTPINCTHLSIVHTYQLYTPIKCNTLQALIPGGLWNHHLRIMILELRNFSCGDSKPVACGSDQF